jgi:hypothetical protein
MVFKTIIRALGMTELSSAATGATAATLASSSTVALTLSLAGTGAPRPALRTIQH